MAPQEAFDTLMEGGKVRTTEALFEILTRDNYDLIMNEFIIYQIEQGSVNIYVEDSDLLFYEIPFDDLLKI